mgnify:CR=1 FL=1|jgi:hypothetical protein
MLPKLRQADLFDEAGYLRLYPDIRAAIRAGQFASGWEHYVEIGRAAGLRTNDVDAAFYLRTYPQVSEAFGPLGALECAVHYVAYGRGRGYLPCAGAERSPVPGGLWTDAPDALHQIDRHAAAGELTDRQAAMLRTWWTDGLLVLDRPAPRDRWTPAVLDLERGFAGACPDLLFACPSLSPDRLHWRPEINPNPAAGLDVHFVSRAIRALILGDPLAEFLRLLLQGPALLGASRGFIRPLAAPAERGSDRFACTIAGRFLSAWIALDETCRLTVWKGGHRARGGHRHAASPGQTAGSKLTLERGERSTVEVERGTVVLMHPDLANAAPPIASLGTARSISAELCPEVVVPLYGEQAPTPVYRHGQHRFTSGIYRDIEPLI